MNILRGVYHIILMNDSEIALVLAQDISDKTRANMCSALHDFWMWLRKRKVLQLSQIPEFPNVRFELGFRKTISKPVQEAILDEIHRLTWHINPKIYMGVKWLCTYIVQFDRVSLSASRKGR